MSSRDVEEATAAASQFAEKGMEGLRENLHTRLHEWKDVPLNIAVIGNSGVGKSTFINTLRGLHPEHPQAARVGVTQTTMDPAPYPYPDQPNFTLWDLPGVGTADFPKATYIQTMNLSRFDYFIIICSNRFTEAEDWLGGEIKAREKKFLFARTKVDLDIENHREDYPDSSEAGILDGIRSNCRENLRHSAERLFLISGHYRNRLRWDFPEMCQHLIRCYPQRKREALVLNFRALSHQVVEEKVKVLKERIVPLSLLSSVGGAIPIPGVGVAADVALLTTEFIEYKKQLGLDNDSIQDLSNALGIDKKILFSLPGVLKFAVVNSAKVISMLAAQSAVKVGLKSAQAVLPIIGTVIACVVGAAISFVATYKVLENTLKEMREAALRVLDVAIREEATL